MSRTALDVGVVLAAVGVYTAVVFGLGVALGLVSRT